MVIESYLNSIQPTSNIGLSGAHTFDGMPYLDVIKSFKGKVTAWRSSVQVCPTGVVRIIGGESWNGENSLDKQWRGETEAREWARSPELCLAGKEANLFGLFFQPEQYFSITTFHHEQ